MSAPSREQVIAALTKLRREGRDAIADELEWQQRDILLDIRSDDDAHYRGVIGRRRREQALRVLRDLQAQHEAEAARKRAQAAREARREAKEAERYPFTPRQLEIAARALSGASA